MSSGLSPIGLALAYSGASSEQVAQPARKGLAGVASPKGLRPLDTSAK